jgi:hypothetical protein
MVAPPIKNTGSIQSSKDFKVGCQFLFIESRSMFLDCNCILHDILRAAVDVDA